MELEQRIIQQSREMMMRYGIRNITMDDIARELGISKKTLYQHYADKAAIVQRVSEAHMEEENRMQEEFSRSAENAIHEVIMIMRWIDSHFQQIPANLLFELQRYYPQAWALFDSHRCEFALFKIIENLRRGIAEGLYRPEMDVELVARIRVGQFSLVQDTKILPPDRYPFVAIQHEMLALFMHSIVTTEGKALFQQYLNTETH
jgi:AcrR family transcriptional regulator